MVDGRMPMAVCILLLDTEELYYRLRNPIMVPSISLSLPSSSPREQMIIMHSSLASCFVPRS